MTTRGHHGLLMAAGGGDPYFANVVSLLHFDGTNGSTTFTDVTGKTWTPAGNAQISTAQSQFGGASGLFDGSGDDISTGSASDWDFGTGDFTIELFARFSNTGTNRVLFSRAGGWSLFGSNASMVVYNGGSALITVTSAITTNVWDFWTVQRASGTVTLWKNGVQIGSAAGGSNLGAEAFYIGRYGPTATSYFNGYIDEFRATKGVARYAGTFTPPASPFPDS